MTELAAREWFSFGKICSTVQWTIEEAQKGYSHWP